MGLIRIYLALAVALTHIRLLPFNIFPADVAVQVFYVISGFYMGLVLNEKYPQTREGNRVFWRARFLRLFPTYALIAVLSALVLGVSHSLQTGHAAFAAAWTAALHSGSGAGMALFSAISQLTMFGLDLHHFIAWSNQDGAHFTSSFLSEPFQSWHLMLVPQAWTLSLELYFYLLAPFLVRGGLNKMLALMAASLALRALLYVGAEHATDPWSYRFFPSELALFMAGALAYRIHALSQQGQPTLALRLFGAAVVFSSILIPRLAASLPHPMFAPTIAAVMFLFIGSIFERTKRNVVDRTIGELSYPLYVSHMLVIWAVDMTPIADRTVRGVVIVLLALALSYALYRFFETPLEKFRVRQVTSGARAS